MPDWTYHPLRGVAEAAVGVDRARRTALRTLATVGSQPGGGRLIARCFGHRCPPASLAGSVCGVTVAVRVGALVPPSLTRDAVRAMPPLGVGFIVVGPVGADDVAEVRAAVAGRTVPVIVDAADSAVALMLAEDVDAVRTTPNPDIVTVATPDVAIAAAVLTESAAAVLAAPAVLIEAGPGWFARVVEAATPTHDVPPWRTVGLDPRRWPRWWWGLLVGLGMIGAGIGAAGIALGPVLLWYDQDYLGFDVDRLHVINHHLVGFLRHDRITMAGTMVAIGALYTGLAVGGIRAGWGWARDAYLISGCIGFPTVFYFLGTGFVEPLHTAVAVVLFPMFLAATWRRPVRPQWTLSPDGPERTRRRALVGQLLMVLVGVGLFAGGATISVVGLTEVFVATDLEFLGGTAADLAAAHPRLPAFIAHDRAGFGGALMSAAAAITLLAAWGWRRGAGWVWWSLAVAAAAGFLPAVAVHVVIHYTDFVHLVPVYLGATVTVIALALSRPYLCAVAPYRDRHG